jgi:hypothetical protein
MTLLLDLIPFVKLSFVKEAQMWENLFLWIWQEVKEPKILKATIATGGWKVQKSTKGTNLFI